MSGKRHSSLSSFGESSKTVGIEEPLKKFIILIKSSEILIKFDKLLEICEILKACRKKLEAIET